LSLISDYCGKTLKDFIAANTASGSTIITDGFSSYPGMNDRYHEPKCRLALQGWTSPLLNFNGLTETQMPLWAFHSRLLQAF